MADSPARENRWLPVLGWAAFVAASWTWCIGMFLPVLLVRQFGLWGWVVFAIPNVLGAAAMGWVLRDSAASGRIVSKHYTACFFFSAITIAFHIFFLGIIWRMVGPATVLLCLIGLAFAGGFSGPRGDWRTAGIALGVSAIAFLVLLSRDLMSLPDVQTPTDQRGLGALAIVCTFGFLFCPHLDLTFHRARLNTSPLVGRAAFTLGFGVFFLAMIAFTLLYAEPLAGVVGTTGMERPVSTWLAWGVGAHLLVQTAYTITLHAREIAFGARIRWRWVAFIVVIVAVAAGAAAASPESLRLPRRWLDLDIAEVGYRLFMAFYGLVFPAYVWLCMIPTRAKKTRPSRWALTVFWIAVLAAAPMYWMGFLAQKMVWMYPGVGVVLLARALIPARQA